jgi:hypothetical protein
VVSKKKKTKKQKKTKKNSKEIETTETESFACRKPYKNKYYTIADTQKLEIPINVEIPWAKEKQTKQRIKNRGRYNDLMKNCAAAVELNSIMKRYTNRYSFIILFIYFLFFIIIYFYYLIYYLLLLFIIYY